jgi:hypothetical protein
MLALQGDGQGARGDAMTLLERWRKVAFSRFAHDLLDECERHGGLDAYAKLIGAQIQNLRLWVIGHTRPSYNVALRMAKISPVLVPHLQERDCLTPFRQKSGRRAKANLTAAKRRSLKLRREPLIRKAARKVNEHVRAQKQEPKGLAP